jgi:EAL domain-containing protein (putative c-di-GMP-specific phosphodiesterase class I)
MNRRKAISVVVVDDHEMILQSIVRVLQEDAHIKVVGTALCALMAIEIIEDLEPDVAILDFTLPDMEASALITHLLTARPDLKIITISGSDRAGAMFTSKRAGSSAWVPKTRAIQELRNAVHAVVVGLPFVNDESHLLPSLEELVVHYQPIVDLADERISGFEALVRWQHPTLGLLYPNAFLPYALETGFIVEIDRWVWAQAAGQLRRWQTRFPTTPSLWMSVNLSAGDIVDETLFESIRSIIDAANIRPADLVIEVTETVLLDDSTQTLDFLNRIKDLGVKLALDDFGTAFSSLSYVRKFPFDHLKLDISFTAELPHSARSTLLVAEICHLASSMDMRSVAEGIEHRDQVVTLREIGCEFGQGYLFARPGTPESCEELLSSQLILRS